MQDSTQWCFSKLTLFNNLLNKWSSYLFPSPLHFCTGKFILSGTDYRSTVQLISKKLTEENVERSDFHASVR